MTQKNLDLLFILLDIFLNRVANNTVGNDANNRKHIELYFSNIFIFGLIYTVIVANIA